MNGLAGQFPGRGDGGGFDAGQDHYPPARDSPVLVPCQVPRRGLPRQARIAFTTLP
jgi:hypothetical protein